jgi:hypothetical protein
MSEHPVLLIISANPPSLVKEESKGDEQLSKQKVVKRTIGPNDIYEVNERFEARLKRIAINAM